MGRLWVSVLLAAGLASCVDSWLFRNPSWASVEKEGGNVTVHHKPAQARALFQATRSGSIEIPRTGKSIGAYLQTKDARPRLLFADCFEDFGDGRFTCAMDPIQFFSAVIVPILNMTLHLDPAAATASVTAVSGEIRKGSTDDFKKEGMGFSHGGQIDASSFQLRSTTKVTWTDKDEKTTVVTSEQSMSISMAKPGWILAPQAMFNRVGNMIVGTILKSAIPEYLEGLRAGFSIWDQGLAAAAA